MDLGLIADWVSAVSGLASAIATAVAVYLAYKAVRIAGETVQRSKLDFVAGRSDRVTDALGGLLAAAAAYKAALQPCWKQDPPIGGEVETEVHRAVHELECSKELLISAIRALANAVPEAWVPGEVDRLVGWVEGAHYGWRPVYQTLVGDWKGGREPNPLAEMLRFRKLIRNELGDAAPQEVVESSLAWVGWTGGDEFASNVVAMSLFENRLLPFMTRAVNRFVARGQAISAANGSLANVKPESIDWEDLPKPTTALSAGPEVPAIEFTQPDVDMPDKWILFRTGKPSLAADSKELILDALSPDYRDARRDSNAAAFSALREWWIRGFRTAQDRLIVEAAEEQGYSGSASAMAALMADKHVPFEGYFTGGQWTSHWAEPVKLILVEEDYEPATRRTRPTGNVQLIPAGNEDRIIRRLGRLRPPRGRHRVEDNTLGRVRSTSETGATPTPPQGV